MSTPPASTETGPGMPADTAPTPTYIDLLLAGLTRDPDHAAIIHGDRVITHRELLASLYRTARALLARGLDRGDAVIILASSVPETLIVRHAAQLIGCRTALLYANLSTADQTAIAVSTGTSAFVYDPGRFTEQAGKIVAALGSAQVLALGPASLGADLLAEAELQSDEPVSPRGRPEDVMTILFTGGSTGRPKAIPAFFEPTLPAQPQQMDGAQEPSRFLVCTAVSHLGGWAALYTLIAGGTVVLLNEFDPKTVLEAIERERVTDTFLTPNYLYRLLDHPALDTTDLSSLKQILYSGCAVSPHRLAEAVRRIGPVFSQIYGQNEAGVISTLTPKDHLHPELLGTAGQVAPHVEVEIRDEFGNVVPIGGVGEIVVRSPGVMTGYWGQPAETARILRDGWLHTGDLGSLDENGYLTVVGRLREMIIVETQNVYPPEVEEPLLTHPEVRATAAFAVSDPDGLESVYAAVATIEGSTVTAEDLRAWVRERKGKIAEPRGVLFVPEIPLTSVGKPDRAALRTLMEECRPTGPS